VPDLFVTAAYRLRHKNDQLPAVVERLLNTVADRRSATARILADTDFR